MCNREEINDDIQMKEAGETKPIGLETFEYGSVVRGTAICLKEGGQVPPSFWGAECYIANNFNAPAADPVTGEGEIATRFMSMTSREVNESKAYHSVNDMLAVFGSEVYSGGSGEDYNTTPVGGMLVQASQQHSTGHLGARLIFCYTESNTDTVIPGAILDDDGTFIVGNLQVVGKFKQGENVPIINTRTQEDKVESLIKALVSLGLVKRDTD